MLTVACFFLISVAYKLAWTAISSLLSQFSRDYGPEVLLQLNIAYFFPSIPVLVLQTMFNDKMDRRLGLPTAALVRFTIGLGGLAVLMSYFPMLATSHQSLLSVTVAVGMLYGVVFGTSYQLASKFPPACTVALTTGFVSSGPVVLLLDLLIKRGPFYSQEGLVRLFSWVGVIIGMGLLAACWIVVGNLRTLRMHSQQVQQVALRLPGRGVGGMDRSDSLAAGRKLHHRGGAGEAAGAAGGGHGSGYSHGHGHVSALDRMESGDHLNALELGTGGSFVQNGGLKSQRSIGYNDDSKQAKRDLPLSTLAWRVSPAAFSIFLSVGTSMLVFPFFTYVHTTGLFGDRLAQVLFYVRLVGDILGRVVPKRLQITSVPRLLAWGFLKTAMVPLLFVAIFRPSLCLGDLGGALLVGVFWVLSGYLNTCSYLLAPQLVPPSQKARASGVMTVAFQSSCFAALMLAGGLQRLL